VISDAIEQSPPKKRGPNTFDHSAVCALKPPQRRFDLHQSRRANRSLSSALLIKAATMCGWRWSNDGVAVPWYGMIFGPIMILAFIVLTVVVAGRVWRAGGLGWHARPG
jgi:hypothetical protein